MAFVYPGEKKRKAPPEKMHRHLPLSTSVPDYWYTQLARITPTIMKRTLSHETPGLNDVRAVFWIVIVSAAPGFVREPHMFRFDCISWGAAHASLRDAFANAPVDFVACDTKEEAMQEAESAWRRFLFNA